jgi:hypothetical protein
LFYFRARQPQRITETGRIFVDEPEMEPSPQPAPVAR